MPHTKQIGRTPPIARYELNICCSGQNLFYLRLRQKSQFPSEFFTTGTKRWIFFHPCRFPLRLRIEAGVIWVDSSLRKEDAWPACGAWSCFVHGNCTEEQPAVGPRQPRNPPTSTRTSNDKTRVPRPRSWRVSLWFSFTLLLSADFSRMAIVSTTIFLKESGNFYGQVLSTVVFT